MKKISISLSILFFCCLKSYSQEMSVITLHYILFNTSIDDVQTYLKSNNFEFDGATEIKDSKGKNYIRCSFLKKVLPGNNNADKIYLWRQKDSTSMFEMLEYNTKNEKAYSIFKNYSDATIKSKKVEKVEEDCISVTYIDDTFIKTFKNCSLNGEKFYELTILNLLVFKPD